MSKYLIKVEWNSGESSEHVYDLGSQTIENWIDALFSRRFFQKITYWPLDKETSIEYESIVKKKVDGLQQEIVSLRNEK